MVQITFGLQTHQLPEKEEDLVVLAKKMQIEGKTPKKLSINLMKAYESHTSFVGNIFSMMFGTYISFFLDSAPAPTIVLVMTIIFLAALVKKQFMVSFNSTFQQ